MQYQVTVMGEKNSAAMISVTTSHGESRVSTRASKSAHWKHALCWRRKAFHMSAAV